MEIRRPPQVDQTRVEYQLVDGLVALEVQLEGDERGPMFEIRAHLQTVRGRLDDLGSLLAE